MFLVSIHFLTGELCPGMTMRLWNYVSTFSNLSGERLHQIYSKLRVERGEGPGPSHANGTAGFRNATTGTEPFLKGLDQAKFEAWKRRRRAETEEKFQVQAPPQRALSNGTRITDPSSMGILGAAPFDSRRVSSERPFRTQQMGLPPRQGFL